MRQKGIFPLRLFCIPAFGLQCRVNQVGHSHEKALYLKQIVTVFGGGLQRYLLCPHLVDVSVEPETKVAAQRNERGLFPVAVHPPCPLRHLSRSGFHPFHQQCIHPAVCLDGRYAGNNAVASGVIVVGAKFAVVQEQLLGHVHLYGDGFVPVLCLCFLVGIQHHMQDGVVIGRIQMVAVMIPVRGFQVDFHVACPKDAIELDLGIEKVGTLMCIVGTGVNDFNHALVKRKQGLEWQNPVFPHIV